MSFLGRYEKFGWDYSEVNPLPDELLEWYLGHARDAGDPVLELACGTGTLVAAFAEAAHAVTGLDLSAAMLDLAGRRVAELPKDARVRAHLVRADMADFRLRDDFAMIVVADNSLREVDTRDDILRCLRCARDHLRPDGRMLIVERRFDPSLFPAGIREHPFSDPVAHPVTGEPVRRRIRVRLDPEAMRIEGEMTYRIDRADGTREEETFRFASPVFRPEEYLPLFTEAGFAARLENVDEADPMVRFVLTHPA